MAIWGFGMPPPGFNALIAQKYGIEQQNANTAATTGAADANLANVRAGLMPAESAATVDETKARAANLNATTRFIPLASMSGAFAQLGQGRMYGADADKTDVETRIERNSLAPASSLFGGGGFGGGYGGGYGFGL